VKFIRRGAGETLIYAPTGAYIGRILKRNTQRWIILEGRTSATQTEIGAAKTMALARQFALAHFTESRRQEDTHA
jgi:hypothetical protein